MRNLKEETFYLASYFDSRMMGLDDNYQTSDATEAEDWAWEHLNQGGYVEIKNQKTGKEVYLDPDDLLFDYDDYASGAFEDAINDSGVLVDPEWHDTADQEQVDQPDYIPDGMDESMGKEIKRYSDVYSDERRNQGWWYFTTHGVQPGSVPKGVNILEVRDTPNGTYFRTDAILNTSELEYYDIKERVPKQEESLKESASMDSAQRLEDDGWVVLSHGVRGGDNNFYWLARRMNKQRGKADWKAINDKTGEVIDITYEQALEREPIGVSSGVSKLSKKLGKVLLPQKINIRESLNKYDLRTDNKYDLRNLYDACIMTDKEKRIIAEMISKNTRANVLYEALMNKFEGKELKESDERNADLDKGIKDEQETINLYDKMSKKKVFNGVEKDQIKEIRNDEKDHKRLLKKIKDGKLTRVEEAYDDADLLSSCKEKYRRLIDIADSAGDFSSIKEVITAMFNEVGGKVYFEEVSRRYASFSGGVKGHSLWNSVSLEYEQADLHRLAEDLTMAFYRTNGGQGYNTYTLMDAIRGDSKNESLKESTDGKFKFNSGDIAYTPIGRDIYIPVTIKDAWFGTEYGLTGNFYSYTYRDGSLCSSCPEQFLLTRDEVQKNGSRLIGESLKEDANDMLRQKAEPLAKALDELTDRDDGFYITYSIGMDDTGAVTGGVDFELFKSSRTEEEAKAEIERVFDENGFELDRRFKTNPGKTLFGRTHYQIIEKGDYTPKLTRDDMNAGAWYESLEEERITPKKFDINGKEFIWDSEGDGKYRVVYNSKGGTVGCDADVVKDWRHKGRYILDRIEGKRIEKGNLTKSEVQQIIRDNFKDKQKNESLKEGYKVDYLEGELAEKSDRPSIEDAYQRNNLTIERYGDFYYIVKCPTKIYSLVKREMKKFYPDLKDGSALPRHSLSQR